MASFSILVTGSPFQSGAHQSALRFAEAACLLGNSIEAVFFYGEAVLVANKLIQPIESTSKQQANLTQSWLALSIQQKIPLMACISTAIRRGIVDDDEVGSNDNITQPNLAEGFILAGLGELAEMTASSNKLIEFGG